MTNLCLLTDSYKATHWPQYPRGTTKVYSYLESRGGKFTETVFTGLQYILDKYLAGENRVTPDQVHDADLLYRQHFGREGLFNREGWMHICHDHSGRLPISIKAAPEGTVVPVHNVLMTIENTCPKCFWLTNYIESILMHVWYPICVATQSREIKRLIMRFLKKNGDPGLVDFKLHDFGFRGVSSVESAAIGGAAHLINFKGSDTVVALDHIARYYDNGCAGFSIPASEHSTITSWGREHEVDAFRNMLDKYPTGLVACVSDSYDIIGACRDLWGKELRDLVLARDGILVIRPDSGDPTKVVLEVLKTLGEAFGITYNDKGYKLLHPKVRVIQGDGVNIDSIHEILRQMDQLDWSADNIAFGMGGALLQKLDRDTQKMAIKCSYIEGETFDEIAGERGCPDGIVKWYRDVFKDPVTDASKGSKRGRLKLVARNGTYYTEPEAISAEPDQLVEVFKDGNVVKRWSFDEVRRAAC